VFESLSDRLTGVLAGLRGKGRLTDADIDATAREIRLALLEADVSLPVVRAFIARIKERAKGAEVSGALNPAQQVVKIVNEELIGILGGETRRLAFAKTPPTVIMLAGLQGAGKTTLAGKLAKWLRGQGHTPLLVACDLQRPGAVTQLKVVGERAGVSVFAPHPGTAPDAAETAGAGPGDPVAVAAAGLAEAKAKYFDIVIVDTAGRLGIDDVLMAQAAAIRDAVQPDETLFVLDAMIGQDAVATAEAFGAGVGFTGVVLTKLDGDARGGAALSVREITGVPILFASTGEKLEDFDVFHPDRMASRILGMGDLLSLIEQAELVFDAKQAEDAAAKIGSGELTLDDFLEQMLAIRKMGPIGNLLGMLPGAGQMKDALAAVDDSQLDRVQAIIRGMTPQERADPKIINASRRLRIANGSGVTVSDVNQLVDRFFEARKMMASMAGRFGLPGAGRRSSNRKGGKSNKGKKGGRGPTPPKVRNPLAAGLPGGFPDLSHLPPGLAELPPGLADFDLSKLKFPGQK
jgi:signal recognition particle subunit SRP54